MPTYEYRCGECARVTEDVREIARRHDAKACAVCYGPAALIPSVPALDFSSATARANAAAGLTVREPGMDRDIERARAYKQEKFDKRIDDICGEVVREFPGLPAD